MKTFEVTQEDIDKGTSERAFGLRGATCPVACSLRRQGYSLAYAGTAWISLEGIGVRDCAVPTPIRVQRFINKFDAGKPISPFRFRLPI